MKQNTNIIMTTQNKRKSVNIFNQMDLLCC